MKHEFRGELVKPRRHDDVMTTKLFRVTDRLFGVDSPHSYQEVLITDYWL